ncbi:zinc ABC transporter substrate-binding protein [Nocardia huaxiensis]|uniref:Zinc ABC transporter substrate-binding protein n=1 Tax=Nocardia huaxiensis TaxID=2755382 RepID=A0A7D6VF28_9NOCA|nr:zinc ABC transporter substrate-binding protein [Nocardia huaxiensis]QLY31457.1 zinc ABC transporter substrate-binding protein [Nocardia huaxiensis]
MTARLARGFACFAAGLAAVATLTACGGKSGSDELTVVASTNVWGDIARTVAGSDVKVESIINDPSADPHSFELSPVDAAKISDAELVVYNGGGYDEFIDKAIAGKNKRNVNAVEIAGEDSHEHGATTTAAPATTGGHDHEHGNEHVWYDVHVAGEVAEHIAEQLGEIDPAHKDDYAKRAADFAAQLTAIEAVTTKIAAEHPNQPVLQTEPLAYYMLLAAKADDRTPHGFQEAVEQETDPAPADVAAVRDLLNGKQVRALVYNIQTESKITEDLRKTAESAGIPVVNVTETLPEGQTYVQWMTANAQALAKALG